MLTGKVVMKPKAYVADAIADKNDVDDGIGDTCRYRVISRGHDDGARLSSLHRCRTGIVTRSTDSCEMWAHVDRIRPRMSLEMAFPLEERKVCVRREAEKARH